jgi:hypothetical protein
MTRAYHCPCGRTFNANGHCDDRDCARECDVCMAVLPVAQMEVVDAHLAICLDSDSCADRALERARMSAAYNARVLGLSC